MVEFVNAMGGVMLVADERVEEYKERGFQPLSDTKKSAKKKNTAKKEKEEE